MRLQISQALEAGTLMLLQGKCCCHKDHGQGNTCAMEGVETAPQSDHVQTKQTNKEGAKKLYLARGIAAASKSLCHGIQQPRAVLWAGIKHPHRWMEEREAWVCVRISGLPKADCQQCISTCLHAQLFLSNVLLSQFLPGSCC